MSRARRLRSLVVASSATCPAYSFNCLCDASNSANSSSARVRLAFSLGAVGHPGVFEGGSHWQALLYALWESIVCVGLCIGLLFLFRKRFNIQGKVGKAVSAS